MDLSSAKDPPNSNEDWFNQESSVLLNDQTEAAKREGLNHDQHQVTKDNVSMQETLEEGNPNPAPETLQISDVVDPDDQGSSSKDKNELEIDIQNDLSPDELDVGNELLPSGSEIVSPEFKDDQEAEIINAFKQGNFIIRDVILYFRYLNKVIIQYSYG